MSESRSTTDHSEIKKWAQSRGGRPAVVRATESGGSGLLRFDFGQTESALEEITWDEFFKIFDERNLRFVYQDDPEGKSRFFKFVYE